MTDDEEALSVLIEQNWFARESYFHRKERENLPSKDEATTLLRRQLTETANGAWRRAEAALWRHRAAHATIVAPRPLPPVRPVRGLFDSRHVARLPRE